jgi:hypothetical protein
MTDAAATGKRKERHNVDWRIVLEDVAALRSIVDAVQPVTPRVSFKIVKDPTHGRYVMHVDAADMAFVCCVSARLVLDRVEVFDDKEPVFCVECKHVLSAIGMPSCAHMPLTMEGCSADAKMVLRLSDAEQTANTNDTEVRLFTEDAPVALQTMEFDLILEVEPALLRELIKTARAAHSEQLRIRVFLPETAHQKVSVTVFTVAGDLMKMDRVLVHDVDKDEDGSRIIRAVGDGAHRTTFDVKNATPLYDSHFPIEKIDAFVKTLTCKMISARAKQGLPLMLTYPLNGANDESSYVRFLVAPNIEDESA